MDLTNQFNVPITQEEFTTILQSRDYIYQSMMTLTGIKDILISAYKPYTGNTLRMICTTFTYGIDRKNRPHIETIRTYEANDAYQFYVNQMRLLENAF